MANSRLPSRRASNARMDIAAAFRLRQRHGFTEPWWNGRAAAQIQAIPAPLSRPISRRVQRQRFQERLRDADDLQAGEGHGLGDGDGGQPDHGAVPFSFDPPLGRRRAARRPVREVDAHPVDEARRNRHYVAGGPGLLDCQPLAAHGRHVSHRRPARHLRPAEIRDPSKPPGTKGPAPRISDDRSGDLRGHPSGHHPRRIGSHAGMGHFAMAPVDDLHPGCRRMGDQPVDPPGPAVWRILPDQLEHLCGNQRRAHERETPDRNLALDARALLVLDHRVDLARIHPHLRGREPQGRQRDRDDLYHHFQPRYRARIACLPKAAERRNQREICPVGRAGHLLLHAAFRGGPRPSRPGVLLRVGQGNSHLRLPARDRGRERPVQRPPLHDHPSLVRSRPHLAEHRLQQHSQRDFHGGRKRAGRPPRARRGRRLCRPDRDGRPEPSRLDLHHQNHPRSRPAHVPALAAAGALPCQSRGDRELPGGEREKSHHRQPRLLP